MHNLLKINIVKMTFFDHKSAFFGAKDANSVQCTLVLSFSCPNETFHFWKKGRRIPQNICSYSPFTSLRF